MRKFLLRWWIIDPLARYKQEKQEAHARDRQNNTLFGYPLIPATHTEGTGKLERPLQFGSWQS